MRQPLQTAATAENSYNREKDVSSSMIIGGTFCIAVAFYFCLELAFGVPPEHGGRTGMALFVAGIAGLGLGVNIFGIIRYVRALAAK